MVASDSSWGCSLSVSWQAHSVARCSVHTHHDFHIGRPRANSYQSIPNLSTGMHRSVHDGTTTSVSWRFQNPSSWRRLWNWHPWYPDSAQHPSQFGATSSSHFAGACTDVPSTACQRTGFPACSWQRYQCSLLVGSKYFLMAPYQCCLKWTSANYWMAHCVFLPRFELTA